MVKKEDKNSYEDLLSRAKTLIPEEISETERLEIPKVKGHIQGTKTIITNFFQICKILDREPDHVLKFLSKELATKADVKNVSVLFNNRIPSVKINEKIQKYADIFVICKECKKPDTEIVKEGRLSFLHCLACGAKHPIRGKI